MGFTSLLFVCDPNGKRYRGKDRRKDFKLHAFPPFLDVLFGQLFTLPKQTKQGFKLEREARDESFERFPVILEVHFPQVESNVPRSKVFVRFFCQLVNGRFI